MSAGDRPLERLDAVCLLGAPLDTGNLGVSALGLSTIAALSARGSRHLTVFDNGRGVRTHEIHLPGGPSVPLVLQGAWLSRRWHRPESLRRMQLASRVPTGPRNPNVAAIDAADVVLDASGGDSFADIYGRKRFDQVTVPKRIVMRRGRPLVLLPQTYGPYRDPHCRRIAARIVRGASSAWARDPESFEQLQALLGDAFDPTRHREAVDVAFTLPARRPTSGFAEDLERWTADGDVVGVNVSGLLSSGAGGKGAHLVLQANYVDATVRLVERLLARTDARILLVPHVVGKHAESDDVACRRLAAVVGRPGRVSVLPSGLDAMETKWVIGQTSWFTGARMHATIAALASAVPVTGIAYSDKMRGVFDSCGLAHEVVDARDTSTDALVNAVWDGYERRTATHEALIERLPHVVRRCREAFDAMLGPIAGGPA